MVSKLLTILFILPVIYAKIEIDIFATDENERDVRISGRQVDLISDTERKSFELTDETLKKSVESYFGLKPNNVFMGGPTPWGGLYKSFKWEPVKRIFTPRKAAILSVERKLQLVIAKDLLNEDSEEKTFKEEIRQDVNTNVSSKWQKDNELSVEDIHYHLDMKKPEDAMYLSYTAKWGEDLEKSMAVNLASDLEINLKPKQKAKLQVFATKEAMRIKVDYVARLAGAVAVNYDQEYKGHRFWALDINTVLEAQGLNKESLSSEQIEFVRFTNAKVLVKDVDTDEVIYSATLEMY